MLAALIVVSALLFIALIVILLMANHNLLGKKVDTAVQALELKYESRFGAIEKALGFHPPVTTTAPAAPAAPAVVPAPVAVVAPVVPASK